MMIFIFLTVVSLTNIDCLGHNFTVWVYWWDAVAYLNESFPIGLMAIKAETWASLMRHSVTVKERNLYVDYFHTCDWSVDTKHGFSLVDTVNLLILGQGPNNVTW